MLQIGGHYILSKQMPRPGVFRAGAAVYPSKIHVKLPAEDFFVVQLFLFQHGDFVDLSLYDAAG